MFAIQRLLLWQKRMLSQRNDSPNCHGLDILKKVSRCTVCAAHSAVQSLHRKTKFVTSTTQFKHKGLMTQKDRVKHKIYRDQINVKIWIYCIACQFKWCALDFPGVPCEKVSLEPWERVKNSLDYAQFLFTLTGITKCFQTRKWEQIW